MHKIAIVDDISIARVGSKFLQNNGCGCHVDVFEREDAFFRQADGYDVVVLDVDFRHRPDVDSIQTYLKEHPGTRLILTSADNGCAGYAVDLNASILHKPYDRNQFCSSVCRGCCDKLSVGKLTGA